MKKIWLLVVAVVVVFACNNNENSGNETVAKKRSKNISSRDLSITRANAYSDLFLDSTSLESFITSGKLNDTLADRMHSFYNTRNFQYAWFNSDGFTEQAYGFWNAFNYYLSSSEDTTINSKSLNRRMNALMTEDTLHISAEDEGIRKTELSLTALFLQSSDKIFNKEYVKRKELERFIPRKKTDALQQADSLLNKKHKDNKYFEDVHEPYRLLKDQLEKYYAIAKQGGWPAITYRGKPLTTGSALPVLVQVKRYLQLTGDLPGQDTTPVFNEELANGVKNFQQRFGLKADGRLTKETMQQMNVPVVTRIKQLLINMDRMRWMPVQPKGRLILVNIPEFKLHMLEDGKKIFDMDVVVGSEGNNTVQFTGTLNKIVFAPYWNIPPNIVRKEILPAIQKNRHYLQENQMETLGDRDNDGLPDIRQLPGEKNSLGKVKFIFRNSFNIYFHDTPAKELFNQQKRAFSHGCIRLSDPKKMADYLLQENTDMDTTAIREAMDSNKEKTVALKKTAEVFITYNTAWVDENGKLNFRDDIYNHDKELISKMFL